MLQPLNFFVTKITFKCLLGYTSIVELRKLIIAHGLVNHCLWLGALLIIEYIEVIFENIPDLTYVGIGFEIKHKSFIFCDRIAELTNN